MMVRRHRPVKPPPAGNNNAAAPGGRVVMFLNFKSEISNAHPPTAGIAGIAVSAVGHSQPKNPAVISP